MIQIHNSFMVTDGHGETIAYNTVVIQPAKALWYGEPWAQYMLLITDEDNPLPFLTERVFVNANCGRGTLQAVYRVRLGKDELVGYTVRAFGLSYDGYTQVNGAEIPPFVKTADEVVITATVYLTVNCQDCALVASDDNPMVLALLGGPPFFPMERYVQWGVCETPPQSSVTTALEAVQNRIPYTLEIIPGGIRLSCILPASALDAVFFMDGKPILRVAARSFCSGAFALQQAVSNERTIGCTYPILSCGLVLAAAKPFVNVQILHVPKRLVKAGAIMQDFGASNRFISDPSYRSSAFVTDKELYIIGQRGGRIGVLASLPCGGKEAHMTDYGEVFLTDGAGYMQYRYVENEGMIQVGSGSFASDAMDAVQTVISKRGTRYTLLRRLQNGEIEWGCITEEGYQQLTRFAGGSNPLLFRNRYFACAITNSDVYVYDENTADEQAQTVIKELRATYNPTIAAGHDGLLYIYKADQPAFNYAYAIGAAKEFLIPQHAKVALCGDFILVTMADGRREIYYYYRDTAQFIAVSIDSPDTVADIGRIGDSVLIRRLNGTLEEYGIESDRSYLYHPQFVPGQNTDCAIIGTQSVPAVSRKAVIEMK